jgi:hypothetical protein
MRAGGKNLPKAAATERRHLHFVTSFFGMHSQARSLANVLFCIRLVARVQSPSLRECALKRSETSTPPNGFLHKS